jgi:transcriptional regulator with XRE-family HTH domain
MESPGDFLKSARIRAGLSTREVERHTRSISRLTANPESIVSNSWVTKIENDAVSPSIHKLYSLAIVYSLSLASVLRIYGLDLDRMREIAASLQLPRTRLVDTFVYDPEQTVPLPTKLRSHVSLESTTLISQIVDTWGDIPIALVAEVLGGRGSRPLCGFIGLKDYSMWPLLRPGSFVIVDIDQRKVVSTDSWPTEHHRPIYFLEMRDGYACGWVQLKHGMLELIPHPLSGCPVREWPYPREVEILGRVKAMATDLLHVGTVPPRRTRKAGG